MSKSTKRARSAWLIAALVVIGLGGWVYWISWIDLRPNHRTVVEHIESLTGEAMPDSTEILEARRSWPDFFGDRYGCYLVQMSTTEFEEFVSHFEETVDPNYLSLCPGDWQYLTDFKGQFWSEVTFDGGAFLVYVDRRNQQILIRFFYW